MGHRREAQNPGRTKYVYLQTDLQVVWVQRPTKTHAATQTLSQLLYFKAARSHSSSTWLSALIALGRRNQSSYLCTGFPGTVPFPGLQICTHSLLKPDAAEFQDGFPPDMPNLKFQLPSRLRLPRLPNLEKTRQRRKPALEEGQAINAALHSERRSPALSRHLQPVSRFP